MNEINKNSVNRNSVEKGKRKVEYVTDLGYDDLGYTRCT